MQHSWKVSTLVLLLLMATGCFPKGEGPRLDHFSELAPAVGEPAPDFVLRDLEGREVPLASLLGDRPIVLQLGSHSCPVYRYRRHWMDGVVEDFQDRVHFVVVYTTEAHPVGSRSPYVDREWDPMINKITGVRVREPQTQEERDALARFSRDKLELEQLMVVDSMANEVWQSYGAASSPAFVIDQDGIVVLRQVWIHPPSIRAFLQQLLAED
jgi:thiol-disulfide isomerase/thioredoxin